MIADGALAVVEGGESSAEVVGLGGAWLVDVSVGNSVLLPPPGRACVVVGSALLDDVVLEFDGTVELRVKSRVITGSLISLAGVRATGEPPGMISVHCSTPARSGKYLERSGISQKALPPEIVSMTGSVYVTMVGNRVTQPLVQVDWPSSFVVVIGPPAENKPPTRSEDPAVSVSVTVSQNHSVPTAKARYLATSSHLSLIQ